MRGARGLALICISLPELQELHRQETTKLAVLQSQYDTKEQELER